MALAALLAPLSVQATSAAQREILIDGNSSDFAADEALFGAGEELDFDSWWGENNDVNQIKLSWDDENLYVAVDGRCWDNNIMLFLDTDPLGGIPDQGRVNSWNRKLFFFGHRPDFFLATWDNNTEPQFWRVQPGATQTVEQVNQSSFEAVATFSQGRPDASMEGALPWNLLYPDLDAGLVPVGAEIALVAVVVTGSDFNSGPDAAPNSSQAMPDNPGDYAFIDNFAILSVDRDGNGLPDQGVSPNRREGDGLSNTAPMRLRLDPTQASIERGFTLLEAAPRAISPNGDGDADAVDFRVTLNGDGILNLDIYDAVGRRVRRLMIEGIVSAGEEQSASWDGRDSDGRLVDAGLYMARVEILFNERRNIPLAVLR